ARLLRLAPMRGCVARLAWEFVTALLAALLAVRCVIPDDPNSGPSSTFGGNAVDGGLADVASRDAAPHTDASTVSVTDARGVREGGDEPHGEPQGPPVIDAKALPACSCAGAHCVPSSLVPASLNGRLADCNQGAKCVPDAVIESGGKFTPTTCRAVGGG